MTGLAALGSGVVGAVAVTGVHELGRRQLQNAPRMDVLGERAIAKSMEAVGMVPPEKEQLHQAAFVGDIISNAAYYSLVAIGEPRTAPVRGALLGLVAGVGGVLLPPVIGLGSRPSNRTRATQAMTVAWYTLGGLAAGCAYRLMAERK